MSGWTTETLKEHFEKILSEKDKALDIALAAAKEAVSVAETNAEKWRDNANEWRNAMSNREKLFIPRVEFDAYKSSAEKALGLEKERSDINQGKRAGLSFGWSVIVTIIGLAGTILAIITRLK